MKQTDIAVMYSEFRHYFGYKMVPASEIDFRITRANSYLGCAITWNDGKFSIHFGKPLFIEWNKKHPKRVTWESILLHEMVHIWEYINFPKNKAHHSDRFMDKLRSIETLTGIPQFWDFQKDWRI